jgi:hypothetical protein
MLTAVVGIVKRTRDRSLQNKRQLQGDPDDPNAEGVLEIAKETREDVEELRDMVQEVHRDVRDGNEYRRNRGED